MEILSPDQVIQLHKEYSARVRKDNPDDKMFFLNKLVSILMNLIIEKGEVRNYCIPLERTMFTSDSPHYPDWINEVFENLTSRGYTIKGFLYTRPLRPDSEETPIAIRIKKFLPYREAQRPSIFRRVFCSRN